MTPELWFLLGIIVFWTILYAISRIFHLEKHGLEVRPAYFMYKSKWMKNVLDRISKSRQVFWKTLANIGIVLSFGLMIFSIYFLTNNLARFFIPVGEAAPIVPIIPGITLQLYWVPYFFAAVTIIILTHEFAHGVAARIEKVPIKSAGIMAALVFFGGFVEPDEKKMEKASKSSKLRIIAAGSSTNLVTYLLVMLLLIGLFASSSSGILIHETRENSPAATAGLQQWDVIYAINDTRILTTDDFKQYITTYNVVPGQNLTFSTYRGNITITAGTSSSGNVSLGILYSNYYPLRLLEISPIVTVNLYMFLNWLSLIAGSVAIFNMLPLFPFDGEKFVYYSLENVVKKRLHEVRIFYNAICFGLIALNIALTFINYGLIPI
jgi:membrane-associated protease RseP (regulator of RpoE activity)